MHIEREREHRFGLFSTTFVAEEARKRGTATALLRQGEAWIRGHGLSQAMTYTAITNIPLIELYRGHGYTQQSTSGEMVILAKDLGAVA